MDLAQKGKGEVPDRKDVAQHLAPEMRHLPMAEVSSRRPGPDGAPPVMTREYIEPR
jgi:hypothetical protein